jgi:16S rRNA (guanine1207-N2)-methyltransferase
MDQYFTNNDSLKSEYKEIICWCGTQPLSFITDRGVFSRNEIDDASLFLVRNVSQLSGRVLDLGCGYGFIGVYCAVRFPDISLTMCDVNRRAADLARNNMERNGVSGTVVVSDGFESIPEDQLFDFILFNPPIHAGRDIINQLFQESIQRLERNGSLYTVMRKKHGAMSSLEYLRSLADTRIVDKQKDVFLFETVKD